MGKIELKPRPVSVGTFRATDQMLDLVWTALNSGQISYGNLSKQFETDFAKLHGCKYAVLSNSGTSSLQVALQALKEAHNWQDGDRVIVPATTFVATANIVRHNRMMPIFVDVDPLTYNIDVEHVAEVLNGGDSTFIKAIIPVHLFGQPADIQGLRDVIGARNIKIVEDSCFVGNTRIPTKTGQKRIKDIKAGDKVLGFDGTTFKETTVVETSSRLVDYTDVLAIQFENGLRVNCTKSHRFYVDGQWVEAGKLKVGDEVWKCSWSEYTAWRRDYKLTDQGRKIISDNMKRNNPSFNPETIKKSATNRRQKPSWPEKRMILTAQEYNLPIDYVGDKSLWIGSHQDGFRNPDFKVRGEKKVIEVYDPTFTYYHQSGEYEYRGDDWRCQTSEFYARYGYETMFIPLRGHVKRQRRQEVADEIRQFISNGVKIVSIKPATKGQIRRYNGGTDEPEGKVRVYNLHCEPHHSFVLPRGILVHNCECMFATHHGKPVGSLGDIGCFSTYVAHIIVTGVGGIATTNNPDYAARMRSLVNHGLDISQLNPDDNFSPRATPGRRFKFCSYGHSFRITEMEAAIGLAQLSNCGENVALRNRNFRHLTAGLKIINAHSGNPLQLPTLLDSNTQVPMMYPIVLRKQGDTIIDKEPLMQWLNDHQIETRDMLPILGHPIYDWLSRQHYPVSHWLERSGFYVGCHQHLTPEDCQYAVHTIGEYFKHERP